MTCMSLMRDHTDGVIPLIGFREGDTWRQVLHGVEGIGERPLTPAHGEGEDPHEHETQVVEDMRVHVNVGGGRGCWSNARERIGRGTNNRRKWRKSSSGTRRR